MTQTSFKICVLGDSAVGKSSVVDVFLGRTPDEEPRLRSGARVETGHVSTASGERQLVVWDVLCADGGFAFETPYLKGMSGALIVCDRTRRPTVTASRALVHRLEDEFPSVPAIVAVNKSDRRDHAEVTDAELDQIRSSGVNVVEISTSSGNNVVEAFEQLAGMICGDG